jgi:hypothetical protein
MTEEREPMTEEERPFHELGEDGVIEAAPDSDDMGDETSDEDDVVADGEPS